MYSDAVAQEPREGVPETGRKADMRNCSCNSIAFRSGRDLRAGECLCPLDGGFLSEMYRVNRCQLLRY